MTTAKKLTPKLPPLTVVRTEAEAKAMVLVLSQQPLVAIDTEYQPGDTRCGRIPVWSLSYGDNRIVVHGDLLPVFARWLANPKTKKVYHNANADLRVLQNKVQKLVVRGFHADTMVMSWLDDENMPHDLKWLAWNFLGIKLVPFADTFGVIPPGKKRPVIPSLFDVLKSDPDKLYEYASLDAYATFGLYQHFKDKLKGLDLWDYYLKVERPYTLLLMEMEDRGITIDVPFMEEVAKSLTRQRAMLMRRIRQRAVEETGDADFLTLNPRSSKQMHALLFDALGWPVLVKTDKDNPSLNAEALEKYAEHGEALAVLLDVFKGVDKQTSGFVLPILTSAKADPNHRVSTSINQIGAATGRVSSRRQKAWDEESERMVKVGMNLQNIPARVEKDPHRIRRGFVAAPGHKLVVCDYSQIELRVIAHESQDPVMLDAYCHQPEKDLHIITSVDIVAPAIGETKCRMPHWDDPADIKAWKERWDEKIRSPYAKPVNFGLNYGMQAYTLSKRLGISEDLAQTLIDGYFERYQGVAEWCARMVAHCKQHGWVPILDGRRRRIPEIFSDEFGLQMHGERMAKNAPIQGGAAAVMKRAQLKLWRDERLKEMEAAMLVQVHDELVFEAPEEHADETLARVKEGMASVGAELGITVPIPASGGIGDSWNEAKH